MAASVQYTGLSSPGRSQNYAVQRKPVELVGRTLEWMRGVEASSARAAAQNTTAMQVSGAKWRSGMEGAATLGATALRAQGDLQSSALAATTAAYQSKTEADALIEREKVARGDTALPYLKLAAAGGLTALGLSMG